MRVVVKEPGKPPRETDLTAGRDGTLLEAMQAVVGGYIEVVPFGPFLAICNEEGKLQGLAPNVIGPYDVLVGTIFVTKQHGEDFADLTPADVKMALRMLGEMAIPHEETPPLN